MNLNDIPFRRKNCLKGILGTFLFGNTEIGVFIYLSYYHFYYFLSFVSIIVVTFIVITMLLFYEYVI